MVSAAGVGHVCGRSGTKRDIGHVLSRDVFSGSPVVGRRS